VQATLGILNNSPTNFIGSLWIDFDTNGTFDAIEHWQIARLISPNVTYFGIKAPTTSNLGVFKGRLRIRIDGSPNGPSNACTVFGSGSSYYFPVRVGTTVGIPSKLGGVTINVFPNPASISVTVDFPEVSSAKFILMDMSGKQIAEMIPSSVNGSQYTLPLNVVSGTYNLTVLTNSGVAHHKLIVK
jgi:hypothetical protein